MPRYILEGPINRPEEVTRRFVQEFLQELRRHVAGPAGAKVRAITPRRSGNLARAFTVSYQSNPPALRFHFRQRWYWQVLRNGGYKDDAARAIITEIRRVQRRVSAIALRRALS